MGRCVLRMDHYCVTVENVVGVRNHGYFVLMVGFGCLGLFYAILMILFALSRVWTPFWELRDRIGSMNDSRHRYRRREWSIWPSNSIYAWNIVVGGEILIMSVAEVIAVVMIVPLVQ